MICTDLQFFKEMPSAPAPVIPNTQHISPYLFF